MHKHAPDNCHIGVLGLTEVHLPIPASIYLFILFVYYENRTRQYSVLNKHRNKRRR